MVRVYHCLWIVLVLLAAENHCRKIGSCEDKKCSHDCEMIGDIPICICPSELNLEPDGKTCKESTAFLLAMFRGVKMLSDNSDEEKLVAPVRAAAIDFHYNKKQLFAYSNYTIVKFPLSKGKGASLVTMVTKTATAATSLAVDWVHDVIYWISQQRSAVEVASLEGADHRVLLTHNDSDTSADWDDLVIDPYVKKLFWYGNEGVYSLDLETESLSTDLVDWIQPEGLAIDTSSRLVYVIGRHKDSSNKYVARVKYDGSKVGDDIIITQPGSKVFGFGVLGKTLYWESNHGGENLYKYEVKQVGGISKVTQVAELNQIVYDMKIFHQNVQRPMK